MEAFSALLALCEGNSPVPGEFSSQRPVTRSFDLRLNKWMSKQSTRWWFETPSCPLWRHYNVNDVLDVIEKASNKELDMILLGDLNYDYVVNESLHADPVYYIETLYDMSQLIPEKTRVKQCTENTLDIISTTNPSLHKCSGVIKKKLKWPLCDFTELFLPKKTPYNIHNTVTL